MAVFAQRDLDVAAAAENCLLESDAHLDLDVAAALRSIRVAAVAAAEERAEAAAEERAEGAEDVGEIGRAREVAAEVEATGTELVAGVAEAVVALALLRVAQDLVCFRSLLEFFGSLFVARIAVRVVFHGKLAVGFLYFVLGGVFRDAKDFVIVAFLFSHGN